MIMLLVIFLLLFLIWASADISSNVYLKTSCKGDPTSKEICLTFDDGPHCLHTPLILFILKKYNIPATFFIIGEKAHLCPHIIHDIVKNGHVVGIHSQTHSPFFPVLGAKKIRADISSCKEELYQITGKKARLFRPPFGVTNPLIARALRPLGLDVVGWSVRSWDTLSFIPRLFIGAVTIKKMHNGAIILLHDRCKDADSLLELLVTKLLEKGYKFVPLEQLLNIKAYEDD